MSYRKCDRCNYVINYSETANRRICPNCDNIYDDKWAEYPSKAALGFYQQFQVDIHSYEEYEVLEYGFHEIQPACLFLCALYEVLLEGLIADILESKNVPKDVAEILLGKCDGQSRLASLFKDLEKVSLKDAINTNSDVHFYDMVQTIIKGRNKYIHGDYSALDQIKIDDLFFVEDKILEVFVILNNTYAIK